MNPMFEAGLRSGWMIARMESLGKRELKRRAEELPEAERRTFDILMQVEDIAEIPCQLGVASLLRLTAAVLDEPEESLTEQMDQHMEAMKEYLERREENGGEEQ